MSNYQRHNGLIPGFIPPFYLKSPTIQTIMGSKGRLPIKSDTMSASAETVIIQAGDGVRLSGAFSTVSSKKANGLVILLHGWEGSSESTYVKATGEYLFSHGFHVFRLNLRDHGDTHHLNEGLFYAILLDEVYTAVFNIACLGKGLPVFLCGFSLGGNFALRIGKKWSQAPQGGIDLKHIVAISPVIDPSKATDAIDRQYFIKRYFMWKWRRSLGIKQHCFPDRYDFNDVIALPTIRKMTERLLSRYSSFEKVEDYFAGYTLFGNALESIDIPTTIITAADDPIIPVKDFYYLVLNPKTNLIIHSNGGHNGFITHWRGYTWYEPYMVNTLFLNRHAALSIKEEK